MKKLILLILPLIALSSCKINPEDIYVNRIKDVDVSSASISVTQVGLITEIVNNSARKFKVTDAKLTVKNGNKNIFYITLTDEIRIPKKTTKDIEIPLAIKYNSLLGILSGIKDLNEKEFTVSGYIKIKSWIIKYNHDVKDMPLVDFIEMTGLEDLLN